VQNKQLDAGITRDDDRSMTILVFLLMALLLSLAARRWGADTRTSRQWEWDPPASGGYAVPR
jgi:hypothetical protein